MIDELDDGPPNVGLDADALDVEGLTPEAAQEYYLRRVTYQKKLERAAAELEPELEKWRGRVALARQKSALDLATEAETRLHELEGRAAKIRHESETEKMVNDLLRERVKRHAAFTPSVDASDLAAQLDALVGSTAEERALSEKLAESAAEDELEALKRKMKEQRGGH
ncbi:MAG: hypothetical protein HYV63_10775 [Candidatus Schekmanbacteria bacterium]|nr:hypothetical protein [Candidatus Schekmanbacteria bacterium]